MKTYEDLLDFLERSSNKFHSQIALSQLDMERYSGNFWDEATKKQFRNGKNRLCATMNVWATLSNAIASRYSLSPWHIDIDPESVFDDELQSHINDIESNSNMKDTILDTLKDAVITGVGYMTLSMDGDDILFEHIRDIGKVAFDPDATNEGLDAYEGAVLDFISKSKCKSQYGEEYLLHGREPALATKFEQWSDYAGQVPIVHYFWKDGNVCFHQLYVNDIPYGQAEQCGSNIPIVRFTGNVILSNGEWQFEGIVRQTWNLMLGINIAYSTLLERCGRSTKANFIANVDSIDGLENYYAKANSADSALVLYKGSVPPTQITESFQTADLVNTIETCRKLIEDVVGMPLSGITSTEKTATEILQQETNRESNSLCYYNAAFRACHYIGTIVIDMLTTEKPQFRLVNGPETITSGMRTRNELSYIAQYLPDSIKPILAKYACDTIKSPIAENIADNIVANLPTDLRFIQDNKSDPEALHQLNQMNAVLAQMKAKIEELEETNASLKKENDALNLSILDNREQRQMDWEKFKIQEMHKTENQNKEFALDVHKATAKAEMEQAKIRNENTKIVLEATKQ